MNIAATTGHSGGRSSSAFRRFGLELAVLSVIALGVLVWHIVSSDVPNVPVAAVNVGEQAAPQTPYYFPSLHVNQATANEQAPPSY